MTLKFKWETEFKQTEIGEIPKEWSLTTLGNNKYFEILPSGIERFKGYKEYLSTSSVQGTDIVDVEAKISYEKRPSRANMQPVKNSVWFARMINSLKVLKADEDLIKNRILSTGFIGIKTTYRYSPEYLFYYFQTAQFQEHKDEYVTGGVQESLTNESAVKLLLPLLGKSEQSCIATVLSWFDDLIENKKKQNEILEKTAMAIFKSWFVDFEPFKDEEFVDSELGKIPKEWEVAKLGTIAEIIMGQSPPSKYYNNEGEGLPFIQGKGQFGRYTPDTDTYCSSIAKLAKVKDILVTVRAPIGELNIADQDYIIGRGVASLRSDYWTYLYLYLLTTNELLRSFERGTTYEAITKKELESFPLLIPSNLVLQKFHSLVEPLFQKIILNQKQIMILRKVKDALSPLLVFGKLRVEEI